MNQNKNDEYALINVEAVEGNAIVTVQGNLGTLSMLLDGLTQAMYKNLPPDLKAQFIENLETTKNELKGDN